MGELEDKSRAEETEKKEKRKKASDEVSAWYTEQKTNFGKRQSQNRTDEKATEQARLDAAKPGANPWERIVDLIDTNARAGDDQRDIGRMRSMLISLKSSPVAIKAA